MVELRWFVNHDFVKVLQYRYKFKAPKKDRKLLEHAWEIRWSEWIDVPTVEEGK